MQDAPLSLAALFRHGENVHPGAMVTHAGDSSTTRLDFTATADRVRRLAGGLESLGVGRGDRVATFMWNTRAHAEAYLAVPAMGAVLHTINVRLRPEEVAYIANQAEDLVVLVDASLWTEFEAALPLLTSVKHVVVSGSPDQVPASAVGYEELVEQGSAHDLPDTDERDAAAMCYTSGTTGRPKGVVYSHRSMYLHSMANCMAAGFSLSDADTLLQVVPMFHANGWGFPHAAWMAGANIVLPDRHLQPERLARLVESERATVSGGVPTVWKGVLEHAQRHSADLSSLRVISCAGSAVPPKLLRGYAERGVDLLQAWGMTETSPLAAIAHPPAFARGTDAEWGYRSKTGRVLPGVEIRAVDDDGTVLPRDGETAGELEVRGPWVTGGYYGEPDDTTRFHDGWLRTGDIGTVDQHGFMKITDRAKDLIKSGGEWISSVDLENALLEHPLVLDVAVIGVPDPRWEERPLVVVSTDPGAEVTADELRAHLARFVARWQVPDRWVFVDAVPKTSVGKQDKRTLREMHAQGRLTETGPAPAGQPRGSDA
jgi:fatty-acyl-CoA synthase